MRKFKQSRLVSFTNRHVNCHKHVKVLSALGTLLILGFVILCGLQVSKLSTRYSIKQFYPKNHPQMQMDDDVQKRFQLEATQTFYVALHLTNSTWLDQAKLSKLKDITTELSTLKNVEGATSLATVEIASNVTTPSGPELRVGTLAESGTPATWKQTLASFPLLKPLLITEDLKSVIIAVEPKSTSTQVLQTLRDDLEANLKSLPKEMSATVSGVPALQIRLGEKLQKEVGDFFAFSLIIFVIMFSVFYRGFSPVAFAAAGLVACNVVVIGALAKAGVAFTVLLSTLPVIVSIAFTSLAIHTLYLWAGES